MRTAHEPGKGCDERACSRWRDSEIWRDSLWTFPFFITLQRLTLVGLSLPVGLHYTDRAHTDRSSRLACRAKRGGDSYMVELRRKVTTSRQKVVTQCRPEGSSPRRQRGRYLYVTLYIHRGAEAVCQLCLGNKRCCC